jgi:16S rRNA (cytidine1402-2'-O)-methyltransferase
MASGFDGGSFLFGGFLPARASDRKAYLESLSALPVTLVFFEAPHRLVSSLEDMAAVLGPRPAFLAREMTKFHEEYLLSSLPDLAREVKLNPRKGEITLVVGAGPAPRERPRADPESCRGEIEAESGPAGQVAARWAARLGISRKDLYALICRWKEEGREGSKGSKGSKGGEGGEGA